MDAINIIAMKKQTLVINEGLIKAKINPREEDYFLVTNNDINNIKSNSFLCNVFLTLTSIFFGGFFSILITIQSFNSTNSVLPPTLNILMFVFLGITILFGIFVVYFLLKTTGIFKNIKISTGIDIIPDNLNEFYISKAKYGAEDKFIDLKTELNELIEDNKLILGERYNNIKGDPIVGTSKTLEIKYFYQGKFHVKTFKENEYIELP